LSHLDYCPVVWSSTARKDLVKMKLAQNRVARLALHCNQRDDMNTMHASLYWHSQLTHSSVTHIYPSRHATRGLFTVPKSRTNSRKPTVLYRGIIALNSVPSHIAQMNRPSLKKTDKAIPHGTIPLPYLT
jgi:hypothetical protein